MPVNYRIKPLVMHENDEGDSSLDSSISNRINKSRKKLQYMGNHHYRLRPRLIGLLTASCIIATIVFCTTLYWRIDHILILYPNSYLPIKTISVPQNRRIFPTLEDDSEEISKKGYSIYDQNISYHDFNYLDTETLKYEQLTYANDNHILYRLPKKRVITGLLLIFHGCSRSAYEWFHTIERQRIIGAAIDLGYGCIAFQSTDQIQRCWSSNIDLSNNEDAEVVFKGLDKFYEKHPELKSLPRFTFGASSGGVFSSVFTTNERYKIQGQILFISIVQPELLRTHVKRKSYPPTAWIYMSRDVEFASEDRINASIKIFLREKIPHITFEIQPISLTSTTFHERIPTITVDTSHYIFYRLQQNQWLDGENVLTYNPRRDDQWQTFLFTPINNTLKTETITKNLQNHEKIISEFLNTIYGEHEISFERSFEALTWLQNVYNNETISTM